uniref:AA_permease_N domain-containing protein n=1 Tax=Heterorhabditis bacteriophora TaxID=37862 RepID=A0A1I7XAZ7_HETBA
MANMKDDTYRKVTNVDVIPHIDFYCHPADKEDKHKRRPTIQELAVCKLQSEPMIQWIIRRAQADQKRHKALINMVTIL